LELDSLMLTRLQQLILKQGENYSISKDTLLSDKFDEKFIQLAIKEKFIFDKDKLYFMTDKLKYMPVTIAKFKLDSKEIGNKYNDNDPDYIESTFRSAKEYHLAGTVLLQKFSAEFEGENILLMNPMCVMAALSCELYLKSLLLKHCIYKKGHKIKELFDYLPEEVKQSIITKLGSKGISKEDFLIELDEASEAFVVIRYANERTGMAYNPGFLGSLLEALYKTCTEYLLKE